MHVVKCNDEDVDDVDPPHRKEKLTYHLLSAGGKKIACRVTDYNFYYARPLFESASCTARKLFYFGPQFPIPGKVALE